MKILRTDYSFNALNRTITFTNTIDLKGLLLITNILRNTIIYNFANPIFGGILLGNVLTLNYNTSSMQNSDELQIFWDNGLAIATENTLTSLLSELQLKADLTETQQVKIVDQNSDVINVYNPFSTDGDSIYVKDINHSKCISVGWTGEACDPFNNLQTEIYNNTSTNPKVLLVYFYRTLYLNSVGMGCNSDKTFSNIKMEFLGSDETIRYTYDDSTNNTKYGTKLYSFPPTACIAIRFLFYTSDTIGFTNITIRKEINVVAREPIPSKVYQGGITAGITCKNRDGNLRGMVISGVTNNSVVTLYDNTSSSGTLLWSSGAMSNQTVPFAVDFKSMPFYIGLQLVISGANCNVLLIFD